MMINFDFLVAGCNTRCQHCYVNGGPGPLMPFDDSLIAILEELPQNLVYGDFESILYRGFTAMGIPTIIL